LGESLTEGKRTFGGWTGKSPEVAAWLEREGREERKKEGRGGRKGLGEPLCPEGRHSLATSRPPWRSVGCHVRP
jgi:hypothetical protein